MKNPNDTGRSSWISRAWDFVGTIWLLLRFWAKIARMILAFKVKRLVRRLQVEMALLEMKLAHQRRMIKFRWDHFHQHRKRYRQIKAETRLLGEVAIAKVKELAPELDDPGKARNALSQIQAIEANFRSQILMIDHETREKDPPEVREKMALELLKFAEASEVRFQKSGQEKDRTKAQFYLRSAAALRAIKSRPEEDV